MQTYRSVAPMIDNRLSGAAISKIAIINALRR